MGRGSKLGSNNLPPTDVDALLQDHAARLGASYLPPSLRKYQDELPADERNRLRLERMPIGTEIRPHNPCVSSRARKAAAAAMRSANKSGRKK